MGFCLSLLAKTKRLEQFYEEKTDILLAVGGVDDSNSIGLWFE